MPWSLGVKAYRVLREALRRICVFEESKLCWEANLADFAGTENQELSSELV
jgi:hypothetical protein